jgi:hypothetical protein
VNVKAVAEEMAGKLGAIDGLRAFGYPVAQLPFPGAVVGLPEEVTYDQTYGRGSDAMTFPVWVMVARGDERAAALELMPYLDGSGARSVKAALDSTDDNTYAECDEVTVTTAVPGTYTYNGVDAFGAEFTVQVAGRGGS